MPSYVSSPDFDVVLEIDDDERKVRKVIGDLVRRRTVCVADADDTAFVLNFGLIRTATITSRPPDRTTGSAAVPILALRLAALNG